uniref:Uncharacterized protein n=1 Tax=Ignisphaera aggregans TaxID=334771 RepID=A0A7C2ZNS2_9CREN
MELMLLLLISAMFMVSAVVTMALSSKIRAGIYHNTENENRSQHLETGLSSISSGYAYTVDVGDSMVIVVVMDKKNITNSFVETQPTPMPIKVIGADVAETPY